MAAENLTRARGGISTACHIWEIITNNRKDGINKATHSLTLFLKSFSFHFSYKLTFRWYLEGEVLNKKWAENGYDDKIAVGWPIWHVIQIRWAYLKPSPRKSWASGQLDFLADECRNPNKLYKTMKGGGGWVEKKHFKYMKEGFSWLNHASRRHGSSSMKIRCLCKWGLECIWLVLPLTLSYPRFGASPCSGPVSGHLRRRWVEPQNKPNIAPVCQQTFTGRRTAAWSEPNLILRWACKL